MIGLIMHLLFRHEDATRINAKAADVDHDSSRPLWQTAIYFALMVAILVFANWGRPDQIAGFWHAVYALKWYLTGAAALLLAVVLILWIRIRWWKVSAVALATVGAALAFPHEPLAAFTVGILGLSVITTTSKGEAGDWFEQSWGFAKQIMPLLLWGVLIAGLLLGRPDHEGLIPSEWVAQAVGGNSVWANLFASVAGAFMYFATLTEVPILQGLIGSGMGQGPALALLLAGPALSLPNMLVIRSVMGTRKTVVFVALVISLSTVAGIIYGTFA